jgi:hypothetical protein
LSQQRCSPRETALRTLLKSAQRTQNAQEKEHVYTERRLHLWRVLCLRRGGVSAMYEENDSAADQTRRPTMPSMIEDCTEAFLATSMLRERAGACCVGRRVRGRQGKPLSSREKGGKGLTRVFERHRPAHVYDHPRSSVYVCE